MKNWGYSYR